jgi:hypothetical protein
VVTFQASMVIAMLAGITLEIVGTPVHHGPFYSVARAIGVPPINFCLRPFSGQERCYRFQSQCSLLPRPC